MERPVYKIFNVIYQIIILWGLFIANIFNELIVPKNTSDIGKLFIKTAALLFEATILLLIVYVINQAVLSDTENKNSRNQIANRTSKRQIIVTLCFIIIVIYVSFKDTIW
jgi:hypothetical protein